MRLGPHWVQPSGLEVGIHGAQPGGVVGQLALAVPGEQFLDMAVQQAALAGIEG